MLICDNGAIWGEEKDRKDNLLLHFIDKCYFISILGSSSCRDCKFRMPCEGNKKEIEARHKEIKENIKEYDRIHAERDSKPPRKRTEKPIGTRTRVK